MCKSKCKAYEIGTQARPKHHLPFQKLVNDTDQSNLQGLKFTSSIKNIVDFGLISNHNVLLGITMR